MNRRLFLKRSGWGGMAAAAGCSLIPDGGVEPERLFFTASGKTCVIDSLGRALTTRLSDRIDKVRGGDEVIITKRGHALVRLVPMDDGGSSVDAALTTLLAIRGRSLPGPETMRDLIHEGRRW
jgi:prevent-host-death family protein